MDRSAKPMIFYKAGKDLWASCPALKFTKEATQCFMMACSKIQKNWKLGQLDLNLRIL